MFKAVIMEYFKDSIHTFFTINYVFLMFQKNIFLKLKLEAKRNFRTYDKNYHDLHWVKLPFYQVGFERVLFYSRANSNNIVN